MKKLSSKQIETLALLSFEASFIKHDTFWGHAHISAYVPGNERLFFQKVTSATLDALKNAGLVTLFDEQGSKKYYMLSDTGKDALAKQVPGLNKYTYMLDTDLLKKAPSALLERAADAEAHGAPSALVEKYTNEMVLAIDALKARR